MNRGDIDAALSFFAADASYFGLGLCYPSPCLGREAIERELERQVAQSTRFTPVPGAPRVDREIHVTRREMQSEILRRGGIERAVVTFTDRVVGERIVSTVVAFDLGDPAAAVLREAVQPAGMPRAGGR